jgi:hypothetical protein
MRSMRWKTGISSAGLSSADLSGAILTGANLNQPERCQPERRQRYNGERSAEEHYEEAAGRNGYSVARPTSAYRHRPIHAPGASDLVLRNVNTGQCEV